MPRCKGKKMSMKTTPFHHLLDRAEADLWSSFERATTFQQSGDVGGAREHGVIRFLEDRLPTRFKVATGEVIDCLNNQTGQLDLVIDDSINTRPLAQEGTRVLLPAE